MDGNAITVFGTNARQGHSVGLRVRGVAVLLTSEGPEHDASCVALAEEIARAGDAADVRAAQETRHAAEVADLRAKIGTLAAHVESARRTIDAATRGERRFNGPVLCRPHSRDQWDGPVWLLDPEKLDGGFGLYFGSLAEVRAAHPELWIVRVQDGGILLDARPLGGR